MDNHAKELDNLIHSFKMLIITGQSKPIEVNATVDQHRDLQIIFNKFLELYDELNKMAADLSAGNLYEPMPKQNRMADWLKNLHGQILHLTWQAKQVAKGDYTQNIDFMGDFADAFNSMISQLSDRELHLRENHEILLNILESMPYAVIAIAKETDETLFSNTAYEKMMRDGRFHDDCTKDEGCILLLKLLHYNHPEPGANEWEINCEKSNCFFNVNSIKIIWTDDQVAYLHTIQDFSQYRTSEKELRAVAFSDEVTGIGNRHSATVFVEDLLEKNKDFQVVFLDMDDLKGINDTFGHQEGDNAIRGIAHYLRSSLREEDKVFRLAGDEFLVIMTSCDEQQAHTVMQRIRARMYEETNIEQNRDSLYELAFSYGVHSYSSGDDGTMDELVQKADMEMYQDKQRRRKERAVKRGTLRPDRRKEVEKHLESIGRTIEDTRYKEIVDEDIIEAERIEGNKHS